MEKTLIILGFLGCFALIIGMGRILIYNDYSTMRIDPTANPDLNQRAAPGRPPVYLVSYADGAEIFFQNQQALAASAINRGIDFTLNYRRSLLDPKFVKENEAILSQRRGAGYWLWKPWVILNALNMMPENAILVYADTGLIFTQNIRPYIDMMGKAHLMFTNLNEEFDLPGVMSKREVFKAVGCDESACHNGKHLWAAFMILKNTPQSRQFIKEWLEICKKGNVLMDGPSSEPEHPFLKNHSHDQSILSALYNVKVRDHKAQDMTLLELTHFREFTRWPHRHPGKGLEYKSTNHLSSYYKMTAFEKYGILNSPIAKWIRKFALSPYEEK